MAVVKELAIRTEGIFHLGDLRDLIKSADSFPDEAEVQLYGHARSEREGDDAIEIAAAVD